MQRYLVDTSMDGKVRLFGKDGEPFDISPGNAYYDAFEADAKLSEKDQLISELEKSLRLIDAINDSPAAFNSDIQKVLDSLFENLPSRLTRHLSHGGCRQRQQP